MWESAVKGETGSVGQMDTCGGTIRLRKSQQSKDSYRRTGVCDTSGI